MMYIEGWQAMSTRIRLYAINALSSCMSPLDKCGMRDSFLIDQLFSFQGNGSLLIDPSNA